MKKAKLTKADQDRKTIEILSQRQGEIFDKYPSKVNSDETNYLMLSKISDQLEELIGISKGKPSNDSNDLVATAEAQPKKKWYNIFS